MISVPQFVFSEYLFIHDIHLKGLILKKKNNNKKAYVLVISCLATTSNIQHPGDYYKCAKLIYVYSPPLKGYECPQHCSPSYRRGSPLHSQQHDLIISPRAEACVHTTSVILSLFIVVPVPFRAVMFVFLLQCLYHSEQSCLLFYCSACTFQSSHVFVCEVSILPVSTIFSLELFLRSGTSLLFKC